jgi:hypothetical protein
MTSLHLLTKMATLKLTRDQARVILTLTGHGKTIAEITRENKALHPKVVPAMLGSYLKRQKEGSRAYVYRLTEKGLHTAKLLFDEETTPTISTTPDSPPLPFS